MDAVMAAMETEAAAEAMAHDGVVPETLVILVEAWKRSSACSAAPEVGVVRKTARAPSP